MTKSTPDIPILDDGAVREIEAHLKRWDRGEVSKQTFPVNWKNAAALCQTVQALRAENERLKEELRQATRNAKALSAALAQEFKA